MTGYGKFVAELPGKKITVEIKSLNSKSFNFSVKLPDMYRSIEADVRNLVSKQLERGKIELLVRVEKNAALINSNINKEAVKGFHSELSELFESLGYDKNSPEIIASILRMPSIFISDTSEIDKDELKSVFDAINKAVENLDAFRWQEGQSLRTDLIHSINEIQQLLLQVAPFEGERIETVKTRLQKRIDDFFQNATATGQDKNRFEQEIIYYLEKLDINEEKVRLSNHCNYFIEVVEEPKSTGKKLGFISQEIGREVNTLGSKANHVEIQKIVVKMKDALERIKEQALNIL